MAAGFFYSKTFKIITTVIISIELIIIITLKVVDLYCDEPGCWNKKDWGTNYCMEHINSIHEEAMTGLRNLVEEITMTDMMMRMITGRRITGNNNARKLWR